MRAVATLLVAYVLCFVLLQSLPGDPLDRLESAVPPEQAERTRRALGLDRPLALQLVHTLRATLQGDFGVSTTRLRPVAQVIVETLPYTALLGCAVLLLAYGIGPGLALGFGLLPAAWRPRYERALLVPAIVPRFWLALVLLLVLHGVAGWFPASHAHDPGERGLADLLHHLVLPALSLGLPAACVVARFEIAALRRTLEQPHVRRARASGVGPVRLWTAHVLRPTLGPAVTLLGLDLPVLVSGAIVIETVFAWPGLGRLMAQAVLQSDYPLALASTLLTALVVVAGRLLGTRLAAWVDPRQRGSAA